MSLHGRHLAGVLLALALALPAGAQTTQLELPPPLLTIDAERLLASSAFGQGIAAEVEAAARRLAEENRRIEAELLAEERALTDRRAELAPEAFRPLAQAFDEKVQLLRAEQDAKQRALAEIGEEGRQRFFREAVPVLSEIVRERGALVLLDRREVFLSADAIDITDEAIARIDAQLPAPVPGSDPGPIPGPDQLQDTGQDTAPASEPDQGIGGGMDAGSGPEPDAGADEAE